VRMKESSDFIEDDFTERGLIEEGLSEKTEISEKGEDGEDTNIEDPFNNP